MAHTYKHAVDAVITSRGADPFWVDLTVSPVPSGPYTLSNDGDGDYISGWHPPDASYGDEPTVEELAAVSDVDAQAAEDAERESRASTLVEANLMVQALVSAFAPHLDLTEDTLLADVKAAVAQKL
jgi:hypothetical protein